MIAPPISPPPVKKRRLRRALGWMGVLSLCLLLAAVVTRAVLIRQMRWPRLALAQDGIVTSVAVTPDGRTVFSGSDPTYDTLRSVGNKPADIFVWEGSTGRLIRRLPGFYWRSSNVTASPDGQHIIASGEAHRDAPDNVQFRVIAWNWQSGQKQWDTEGDAPLSYSPDGRFVGSANGIFDAVNGKLICRTSKNVSGDGQSAFTTNGKLFGIIDGVHLRLGLLPNPDDGKSFYSTTRLHFWHTDTGKEAQDLPFTRVRAFSIVHTGQWLIMVSDADGMTGGTDGSVVRRVDINTGKVLWTRERRINGNNPDPEAVLNSVAVSPNGKYVVLASINNHLIILSAQSGRELFRPFVFSDHSNPSWAIPGGIAFSADGKTLVSRCGRRVLVWDATALQ